MSKPVTQEDIMQVFSMLKDISDNLVVMTEAMEVMVGTMWDLKRETESLVVELTEEVSLH